MASQQLVEALALGLTLGVVMGLLGGGGGVLAVPLFVYVLGLPLHEATALSLGVVLVAALAALIPHTRAGTVYWRQGLAFGAMGAVGAVVGSLASPRVPERLLLLAFGLLVLAAGFAMLRDRAEDPNAPHGEAAPAQPWGKVLMVASVVGLATGFFGVGGGFLVVPALVLALRIPMHHAAATGLVVIALNSAVGLATRAADNTSLDWAQLGTLAGAAAVGAVAGALLAPRVPGRQLRRLFGGLMLGVAAFLALQVATS